MNITVERVNWTGKKPDLVVLVGDPHADYAGALPAPVEERLRGYAQGFVDGTLRREIQFSSDWENGDRYDFIYYHTSAGQGFTPTENLKTFLAKALRLAAETGRERVAFLLRGPDGEGLLEQLVEGALVGTFSFREYKKENSDSFSALELVLVLPTPEPAGVEQLATETVAEEKPEEKVTEPVEETASGTASVEPETAEGEEAAEGDPPQSEEPKSADPEPSEPDEAPAEESSAATEEPAAGQDEASLEEGGEADGGSEPDGEPVNAPAANATIAIGPEDLPSEVSCESTGADEARLAELRSADETAVRVGRAFAEGVNLARTLVARPASECTPDFLAKTCKKLASTHRFSYQSFGPKQLESHGYAGLVTVGKGSENSPRMIEMTYSPESESNVHLVLVGKGVTFDSGGISIKPADKMHLMIGDMAGAAAVIGAMETLGQLRPTIKVTALIVSAENKPGSKSYRPGDIIRYKNGISVHVENTDAEGRLILADGLIRAGELGATHIVDVATLTGACVRALGPSFTGIMGANRKLVNAITRAGGNHGESYWRLPMPLEYKDMLKSVHADLNNVGGPYAGATTAALFLKEFVPGGTPWVHLDIAGTFWKEKPWKYYQEGPSGTGVKTIADLALRWREHLG